MFDFAWLVAQGEHQGKPMLLRVREVPARHPCISQFPNLLVAVIHYGTDDATGLPASDDYDYLEQLERQVLDALEAAALGIVSFVRTTGGVVQYFIYAADIVGATEWLTQRETRFEYFQAPGDQWSEYNDMRRALGASAETHN